MKLALSILLATFFFGCSTTAPAPDSATQIKYDLVGHTMGGREKSWKFQSADQIKAICILSRDGDKIVVGLMLHDSRVTESYSAVAELTYRNGKLVNVGELFIRQL